MWKDWAVNLKQTLKLQFQFRKALYCQQCVWKHPYFSSVLSLLLLNPRLDCPYLCFCREHASPFGAMFSVLRHLLWCWPLQGHHPCVSRRWAWTLHRMVKGLTATKCLAITLAPSTTHRYPWRHSTRGIIWTEPSYIVHLKLSSV